MTKLQLLTYPDPRLYRKSEPVDLSGGVPLNILELIENMAETMYDEENPGVGLAAPQVGVLKRVIVVDVNQTKDADGNRVKAPMAYINPEITVRSSRTIDVVEGCLSIPGYYDYVSRPRAIHMTAYTKDGAKAEIEATDLLAVALQHEVGHLDGILFVQMLSKLKRDVLNGKLKKAGLAPVPPMRMSNHGATSNPSQ